MEWPKAVVICGLFSLLLFWFFFFLRCVLAHTKHFQSPGSPGVCRTCGCCPPPLSLPPQGNAGADGSRRRPPPALAAGPSPSGEPSGSWRCGAAGQHGGPGAAGSLCWDWGPWEEVERFINRLNNSLGNFINRVHKARVKPKTQVLMSLIRDSMERRNNHLQAKTKYNF